jgi:hypothetical protein
MLLWKKKIQKQNLLNAYGDSLFLDNDSYIYLTGRYTTDINDVEYSFYFISKYDKNGVEISKREYGWIPGIPNIKIERMDECGNIYISLNYYNEGYGIDPGFDNCILNPDRFYILKFVPEECNILGK